MPPLIRLNTYETPSTVYKYIKPTTIISKPDIIEIGPPQMRIIKSKARLI